MPTVSSKNSIVEAMRHHSKGREVSVEIVDYGYAVFISVETVKGSSKGHHTTRLPAQTPCVYEDPEKQLLYLMGFIPPNYRQSTKEDNIKYAVDFVKRMVGE